MEDSLLCPDWVWSNNSNVHTCKDRGWFTDYTPFSSFVTDIYTGKTKAPVMGFGTVEIRTKRSPARSGRDAHGVLKLKNVLHVPSLVCNVIGLPDSFLEDYIVIMNFKETSKGKITDHAGRSVAYFDPKQKLLCVKLSGPPVGPRVGSSVFEKDACFFINALWPESEVAGFFSKHAAAAPANLRPFDEQEKKWLKDHYGDEYHFLREHGLNIYKEEDRVEGRELVRSFMAEDPEQSQSDDDMDDAEEGEEDWDPEGHFADRFFTMSELDFIENSWGNSQAFMESYLLKFYDDDDCREAADIVRNLMERAQPSGQ